MRLNELLRDVTVTSLKGSDAADVTGVTCDSRQVRPGYLFVAVPGTQGDGWDYAQDALDRGARVVISERPESIRRDATFVCVPQARTALAWIAANFHGRPADRLTMVGITGTNGKTTTAFLVRDILRAAGRAPGLITTVLYEMGARTIPAARTTPEASVLNGLLAGMVGAGCDTAVMEVSSHALVQDRVAGIDYDVAAFTNLSRDHLDYHGDMESYFAAKARLFAGLGRGRKTATAVIHIDDPWGARMAVLPDLRAGVVTCGACSETDVCAEDIRMTMQGTTFKLRGPWGSAVVRSRLLGRFNIGNMLTAAAICGVLGVPAETMGEALAAARDVRGRLEETPTGRGFKVFVDYAHTDDALAKVLSTLRELSPQRLIVVFGCGGNRDRGKRPLMGRAASEWADLAILTSDNPRKEAPEAILEDVRAGCVPGADVEVIEDRRQAIRRALQVAGKGDVILIAGKGHEEFQEVANRTIPFDDRQVVKAELETL